MRRSLLSMTCCALLAACTVNPTISPARSWPVAPRTFADAKAIDAVAAQFPNSSGMQRRRLGAALEAKDAVAAVEAATRLAAMGAGLSPGGRGQIAQLIGEGPVHELSRRFDANAGPVGTSRAYAQIAAEHQLIEGLIWDTRKRRLYATSVVDRRLLALEPQGAKAALESGLGSLFGGACDPVGRKLWIASAVIEQTPKDKQVFSGLIGFDPETGETVKVAAPEGVTLGDVAVGRDGTVYASDGMTGGVYRCWPGCTALERLVPEGSFFSAQGLAVSDDGKLLYVADYRYGLAAVDLATGRLSIVGSSEPMMLDGIDGLASHGRDLIAIQNGTNPVGIVRLHLALGGLHVERLEVLERASEHWTEPSLGRVVGGRFLYVANPQWERFGEGGAVAAGKPAEMTRIRAIDLD